MLGVVNYLSALAKQMRSHDALMKKDLVMLISSLKDGNETPDEIKKLVDIILEELKEKEN
jgi:flavodoxin